MDISVVIPVYNTAEYLERCLDSVLGQKFDGVFEIIAVDDASTDDSLSILKKYAAKDSRLKIITLPNRKMLSSVRVAGLREATGNYIMQLDSDDWYLPETLQTIFDEAVGSKADVVAFNLFRIDESGSRIYPANAIKEWVLTTNKEFVQPYFRGASVCKMIRRELTEDMLFYTIDINNGEDLVFLTEILFRAKKILLTDHYFYAYYCNHSSITRTTDHKLRFSIISYVSNTLSGLAPLYNDAKVWNMVYNYQIECFTNACHYIHGIRDKEMGRMAEEAINAIDKLPITKKANFNLRKMYSSMPYFLLQIFVGRMGIKSFPRLIKWTSINLVEQIRTGN